MKIFITILILLAIIFILLVIVKLLWVFCKTFKQKNFKKEEKEVIQRARYLISKVAVSSKQLIDEMPKWVPSQFQGEWAIYSCSMTCKALANISKLYPKYKDKCVKQISNIIDVALSKEIRKYDCERWNEDPLDGINGHLSHLSYYSHLAWMISEYKSICEDDKYDQLYHSLCKAMNDRIIESPSLNIETYPGESIYVPDMLVAIVALSNYSQQYNNKYKDTVKRWLHKAKTEWIDHKTGLLFSFLTKSGSSMSIIRGSYSSLNCYYLSLIDYKFAKQQYNCLKASFRQNYPFTGIKEYNDRKCLFGFDIDAGPILFNLSPSGTAFAIGCATMHNDYKFRKQLLRTAEIAGHSITWKNKTHYLLANYFLVGEAISLAMRTSKNQGE